ncbi:GAF domain-containing protein [Paenarthrobacter sp. DKR-5]|uniref:helix-turn-helix domain-containing protein n=1 Tax=Paenarthrobacter sp. DKR-5 TaxID=2835535 RepID=UPI001BDC4F2E|nr:GAF domain-containing protein [Paenarthrobacter sp. DKR-5]MBT1002518.1 GAF domain-containing protein [Paenarthrobacter sp. DKR-5]
MTPPHLRPPGGLTSPALQRRAFAAHDALDSGGTPDGALREVVKQSWERSLRHLSGPEAAVAPLVFDAGDLEAYRSSHPLAAVMPVIQRLLVAPSYESGLLVAVGDENGRLLWVDGDAALRRKAEGMLFVSGADWSEHAVGTSAPGTALALDASVQIAGAEHFSRSVHPWSCTAVPLHDPDSGSVLGVVDITGTEDAVALHTLSLVEATVAAAEAQLRVHRLQDRTRPARRSAGRSADPGRRLYRNSLQILGREQGVVNLAGRSVALSERHAELLTLLALNPSGLSAEELAAMVYPGEAAVATVRAEMVRLRKLLQRYDAAAVPDSRPYRLPQELVVDAQQVLSYLSRGAHRLALNIYRGEVLPRSEAPAVVRYREKVSAQLREAIVGDAGVDVLLQYLQLPEAENDAEAWREALRLLPARSPRRVAVVTELERLEAELR